MSNVVLVAEFQPGERCCGVIARPRDGEGLAVGIHAVEPLT